MGLLSDDHRKLAKAIRQWKDAHSVSADLRIAEDLLDRAMRMHLAKEDNVDLLLLSILHSTVMCYARALERKSRHRATLPITGQMTPAQRQFHDHLVDLRDESIGHHGPAGTVVPWAEDSVVMIQEGVLWQPAVFARRSLFDHTFARAFLLHLQAVQPVVSKIVDDRRRNFQIAFDDAIHGGTIDVLLMSCRLPEKEVDRLREPLLNQSRQGRAIGIWSDPHIFPPPQ